MTATDSLRKLDASHFTVLTFLALFACACGIGILGKNAGRPLLKFCFNSKDQFVAAQCVLCDFYKFSATVLACNGKTSALMSNVSSTEAVCIISNCLQQVRQPQPQFIGRKRREAERLDLTADIDEDEEEDAFMAGVSETTLPAATTTVSDQDRDEEESMESLEERVVETIEVSIEDDVDEYDDT